MITSLMIKSKIKVTGEGKQFTIGEVETSNELVGEIEILSNGEVYATLSIDKTASVRDALRYPIFNLKTNIFDKKLNEIPYFDFIYQYIINHNLQNVIVEFAIFDIKVGIKKENIIIYELRTHY